MIVSVAPVDRPKHIPDAKETAAETQARYESIANDLIEVVYDVNEKPLFEGEDGRAKTVAVLLAIANFESGYRKDVDFGKGRWSKGDGGRSWCLHQLNLGRANWQGRSPTRIVVNADGSFSFTSDKSKGWGGEDLVADRKKCFRAALAVARNSFNICPNQGVRESLNVYTSGHCNRGHRESRRRMGLALKWMSSFPGYKDQQVFAWKAGPTLEPTVETAAQGALSAITSP